MAVPARVVVSAAVEGIVDEAVVRRLITVAGGLPGTVYGKNGKPALRERINGYNNAARHTPWIVLIDLDRDAECAPQLRNAWVPEPADHLCFRVALCEVESWLMADAEAMARFLGVARGRVPRDPETIVDPKQALVNLARASRRRDIREDIVPREGSGRSVGPAYNSRLIEYVEQHWRPEIAAQNASSLRRAIACVERVIGGAM